MSVTLTPTAFKVTQAVSDSVLAPAGLPVSVKFAPDGGTATVGKDILLTAGTLRFKSEETERRFAVRILRDQVAEPAETIRIRLFEPTNAALGAADVLTLTIGAG